MVYLILNLCLFGIFLSYSFTLGKKMKGRENVSTLENLSLFLSLIFLLMAAILIFIKVGSANFNLILCKSAFFLFGCFSVSCCVYMISYTDKSKKKIVNVMQWILYGVSFFNMFLSKDPLYEISVTQNSIKLFSAAAMNGLFKNFFYVTWIDFHVFIFALIIPVFTCLMAQVKAENCGNKLTKQAIELNICGVILSWLFYAFIVFTRKTQPIMIIMLPFIFVPELLCFIYACKEDELWGKKRFLSSVVRVFLHYIIPSVLIGFIFVLVLPKFKRNYFEAVAIYSASVVVISAIVHIVSSLVKKTNFLRDNRYADRFENELSNIDFIGEATDVTKKAFEIFSNYVGTSSMKILVDDGTGTLPCVYSSEEGEKENYVKPAAAIDVLLNMKQLVVMRENVMRNSSMVQVRTPIIEFMNVTNSEAFIILNEGRNIVGIICLGKKVTGNTYSEYDYNTFKRVYSHLFVLAYYVKNIMNESIVGTVNREIKMSGQIITSIQENMDQIKNPKVDAAYSMIPAHNIGGEFVDLIRLSDTRHIFVIGALSGKGIAASMNMVILKSIIRTFLAETKDFKLLVQKVNLFIRESLPKGTYFSGVFGLVDFKTNTLYYINCGTPVLFLYTRAYNNVIEIQGEGRVLGFVRDLTPLIKVKKVTLSEGDIVFACTDGLIETRSLRGEKFGKSRIQSTIVDNLFYPANRMARFMYEGLTKFASKVIENDVTLLLLKYKAENAVVEGGE